jgi:hypothetical protein
MLTSLQHKSTVAVPIARGQCFIRGHLSHSLVQLHSYSRSGEVSSFFRRAPQSRIGEPRFLLIESTEDSEMMGRRDRDQGQLFCEFKLDEVIPKDHLLRRMNVFVTAALADLVWSKNPSDRLFMRPIGNGSEAIARRCPFLGGCAPHDSGQRIHSGPAVANARQRGQPWISTLLSPI